MGNISKSLARLIWGSTATTTPAALDRIPLSPNPNTPMVTESKHVTYADLIAGAAGLGYGLIKKASKTLDNAQIKALPETFIQIANAPGLGKINLFIAGVMTLNTAGGAYAGVDNDTELFFGYGAAPIGKASGVYPELDGALRDAHDGNVLAAFIGYTNAGKATWLLESAGINLPLYVGAANPGFAPPAHFTNGHADNTLDVTAYYVEVDV